MEDPPWKKTAKIKKGWGHGSSKHKALSSNSNTAKKKKENLTNPSDQWQQERRCEGDLFWYSPNISLFGRLFMHCFCQLLNVIHLRPDKVNNVSFLWSLENYILSECSWYQILIGHIPTYFCCCECPGANMENSSLTSYLMYSSMGRFWVPVRCQAI
jgi:hypothetical protein